MEARRSDRRFVSLSKKRKLRIAISSFLSSSGVRQTDSKNGFTSPSRNRVSSFAAWLISSLVIFFCPGRSTSSRSANAAKISSWRPSVIWRRVSAISQSFCLRSGCGVMTRSYVLSADFPIRFVKRASWMEFVGAHACLYRISSADFAIHQEIARILCLFRCGKEMPQVSCVLSLMLRPVDGVFVILLLSRYDMVGDLIGSIRVFL